MIEIVDIRYCRLGTADLDETVRFATELIGLELVDRENGAAYVRGDDRDHNICYLEGDPADQTLGFEVRTLDELAAAETTLQAAGVETRRGSDDEAAARRCMGFINFNDPTGRAPGLACVNTCNLKFKTAKALEEAGVMDPTIPDLLVG